MLCVVEQEVWSSVRGAVEGHLKERSVAPVRAQYRACDVPEFRTFFQIRCSLCVCWAHTKILCSLHSKERKFRVRVQNESKCKHFAHAHPRRDYVGSCFCAIEKRFDEKE